MRPAGSSSRMLMGSFSLGCASSIFRRTARLCASPTSGQIHMSSRHKELISSRGTESPTGRARRNIRSWRAHGDTCWTYETIDRWIADTHEGSNGGASRLGGDRDQLADTGPGRSVPRRLHRHPSGSGTVALPAALQQSDEHSHDGESSQHDEGRVVCRDPSDVVILNDVGPHRPDHTTESPAFAGGRVDIRWRALHRPRCIDGTGCVVAVGLIGPSPPPPPPATNATGMTRSPPRS